MSCFRGIVYGVRSGRTVESFPKIRIRTDTAWICVFQNRNGWLRKFPNQVCCRVDVEDVVIRQFLAVELVEEILKMAIYGSRLVWILSVTQAHFQW